MDVDEDDQTQMKSQEHQFLIMRTGRKERNKGKSTHHLIL